MQTIHPAIARAAEVYDLRGDLEPHQAAFTATVHAIRERAARTKGLGVYLFGDHSEAALCSARLADRQMAHDLDAVLAEFELTMEDA